MLEELKSSIPVKTSNLKKAKNIALLGMVFLTTNVNADTFYNDYHTQDFADSISRKVAVLGKFEEVRVREILGCKTGDLREELGGLLRHVHIQNTRLDITEENYADKIDEMTSSAQYKRTGRCGQRPDRNPPAKISIHKEEKERYKIERAEQLLALEKERIEKQKFVKQTPTFGSSSQGFEMPQKINDFEIPKQIRDLSENQKENKIAKINTKKGIKL